MVSGRINKRLFPRVNFEGPLRFQIRGSPEVVNTVVDDISQSGIGFINQNFIPPSTTLNLEINILNRIVRPIGQVMWSYPTHSDRYRLGVHFLEIDAKEKKHLADFLKLRGNQLQGV